VNYVRAYLQLLFMRSFWKQIGRIIFYLVCGAYYFVIRRVARRVWYAMRVIAVNGWACLELVCLYLCMVLFTGRVKPE
jgi:hypothetical protein